MDAEGNTVPRRVQAVPGLGRREEAVPTTATHASSAITRLAVDSLQLRRAVTAGRVQGQDHFDLRIHPKDGFNEEGKKVVTSNAYHNIYSIRMSLCLLPLSPSLLPGYEEARRYCFQHGRLGYQRR